MLLQVQIPFISFSAPSVAKRPGFGEQLLSALTSAVVGGATNIVTANIAGKQALARERERLAAQTDAWWEQHGVEVNEEFRNRASTQGVDFPEVTRGGRTYTTMEWAKEVEAREDRSRPVDLPGVEFMGEEPVSVEQLDFLTRSGLLPHAVRAPYESRLITSELAESQAEAYRQAAQYAPPGVDAPDPIMDDEVMQGVASGEISIAANESIQRMIQFGTGAALESMELARSGYWKNYEEERKLQVDALNMSMGEQLRNRNTGEVMQITSPIARQILMNTDAWGEMENEWEIVPREGPLDILAAMRDIATDEKQWGMRRGWIATLKAAGAARDIDGKPLGDPEIEARINNGTPEGLRMLGGAYLAYTYMMNPEQLLRDIQAGKIQGVDAVMLSIAEDIYRSQGLPLERGYLVGRAFNSDETIDEISAVERARREEHAAAVARGELVYNPATGEYNRPTSTWDAIRAGAAVVGAARFGVGRGGGVPRRELGELRATEVRGASPRFAEMGSQEFIDFTGSLADRFYQNPADTTNIFQEFAALRGNADATRNWLRARVEQNPNLSAEQKAAELEDIGSMTTGELVGFASDLLLVYNESVRIAMNRRQQDQQ